MLEALTKRLFGAESPGSSLILGETNSGKSFLMTQRVLDCWHDHGVAVVDPHSDFGEHLLRAAYHEGLGDRVVLIEPTYPEYAVGLNLLEVPPGRDSHHYAREIIKAFKRVWAEGAQEAWGARMESILLNTLLTLMDEGNRDLGLTILEAIPLLTNEEFRDYLVDRVTNPDVRAFWHDRFNQWGRDQILWAESTLNKLNQFLTPELRHILGQSTSTVDLRQLMDDDAIIIVNLNKPVLKDTTFLLGSLILTKIVESALSRVELPQSERTPFVTFIDEAHNIMTSTTAELCSEGRKFGLYLELASQTLSQIREDVRPVVLGNTRNQIAMRISREDAEQLASHFWQANGEEVKLVDGDEIVFAPIGEQHEDFINRMTTLKQRQAWHHVRGGNTRKIRTRTIPDYAVPHDELAAFKAELLARHGRPKEDVEEAIQLRRFRLEAETQEEVSNPTEF